MYIKMLCYFSSGNKICGSTAPVGVYQTSGRYLTVYFHSDGSDQFSGFDMIITSYHTGECLHYENLPMQYTDFFSVSKQEKKTP